MSQAERIRRSAQTSHEALAWFRAYHETTGRMPTDDEVEGMRGPNPRIRKRLGGLPGIAKTIGLEGPLPKRYRSYEDAALIRSLSAWIAHRGTDTLPTAESFTDHRFTETAAKNPSQTYSRRFGSWRNALEETGFFKFNYTASDCVAFARQAKLQSPGLNLKLAIQANNKEGFTPLFSDVLSFYPSLKALSRWRLSWDEWQTNTTKFQRERNVQSLVSYGVLALATVDGDMRRFNEGNKLLHEEDRGPVFSKAMYAQLAPQDMHEQAGYIWALDLIERIHDVAIVGKSDGHIPIDQLRFGSVSRPALIHPTFQPEIEDLASL